MTSYGHGYYTYLKKQKVRAGTRAISAMMDFHDSEFKDANDFDYACDQHFSYLYYAREMKRWRKNIKKAILYKSFRGKRK